MAGSSACTLSMACLGAPGTASMARLPIAGSASSAVAARVQIEMSLMTCAVTSTGLSSEAKAGSAACRAARVASAGTGMSRPIVSAKSSAKPLMAPELVMTPAPPVGGCARARRSAASISSSIVSTSTTASWRRSAVITAWSPASAPVCVLAESRARALLPGCKRMIGLRSARAREASDRNSCGRRICSRNRAMARVCELASRKETKSSAVRSASLPVETAWDTPRPLAERAMRKAPASAPLCVTTPTAARPAIASGAMVSKVSDTPSAKLQKPMQFGPSMRTPAARAVLTRSSCSARPLSPTSANPDANTTAPPICLRPQAATASTTAGCGTTRTAASMPSGRSSMVGTQGRPLISLTRRLTR